MELEHAFQQSGVLVALQLIIAGSMLAPGVTEGAILFQRFIRTLACYAVSFGPVAILVYMLYRVSQLN